MTILTEDFVVNTITETKVLLYYRRPYQEERELICVCESEAVANTEIHRLMEEWIDLYPEPARFETSLVSYVRRAY
jgi:hypothetical protein